MELNIDLQTYKIGAMKPSRLKLICLTMVFSLYFHQTLHRESAAQESILENELVNLGLISFSRQYRLVDDASFIIFKIRNNSTRTITNIYGWAYRYHRKDNGEKIDLVLINNPYKSGTLIIGRNHLPGTIAEWRFALVRGKPTGDARELYTLRVSPKSIYFAEMEPLRNPADKSTP